MLIKCDLVDEDLADVTERRVLVRLYGKNVEVFFDRNLDQVLFVTLAERGFGPRLYGLFPEGRIERKMSTRVLSCSVCVCVWPLTVMCVALDCYVCGP